MIDATRPRISGALRGRGVMEVIMTTYILSAFREILASGLLDGFLSFCSVCLVILIIRKILLRGDF